MNLSLPELTSLLTKKQTLLQEMLDEQSTFRYPRASDYTPEIWNAREEYLICDYNELCSIASRMISELKSEIDTIQLHITLMNMPDQ